MKFRVTLRVISFALVLTIFTATLALATTVTISPSGNGIFVIQGTDLDNVAGIDVVINYDATTMANPRVIKGDLISGALMVANTSQKGIVRIAAIDAYPKVRSGSGTIATVTFDLLKPPGKITNFTALLDDVKGSQLSAQAKNDATGETTGNTSQNSDTSGSTPSGTGTTTTTTTTTTTAAGGGPAWVGGSVTMPSDGTPAQEKSREGASPIQAEAGSKGVAAAPTASEAGENQPSRVASLPPAQNKITVHKSVLERFREFQGEKTPKTLMALFDSSTMPGIRQEPPIAISDGKTRLKVFIDLPAAGKETPNFALKGAQLESIKMTTNSTWMVEALPGQGVYDASITVMLGESMTEIPLAVAPQITISNGKDGITEETAFEFFLKNRGSVKAPRFDLNGDGKRNYIDDYIFTVNYLVLKQAKSSTTDKK